MNEEKNHSILKLIDSHCHLFDEKFNSDRNEIILSSLEKLDGLVIIIEEPMNVNPQNLIKHKRIRYSVGFHPYYAEQANNDIKVLNEFLTEASVTAIGEIGLDYFHCKVDKEIQKKAFIKQIKFAYEKHLPIVVHCRNAEQDTYNILKQYGENLPSIVLHCYGGNVKMVESFLSIGCFISFAGNITFPKATELKESVTLVPLNSLLVETDAPYLAPQPVRGKRCIPEYIFFLAQAIAEIKKTNITDIIEATHKNTKDIFRFQ